MRGNAPSGATGSGRDERAGARSEVAGDGAGGRTPGWRLFGGRARVVGGNVVAMGERAVRPAARAGRPRNRQSAVAPTTSEHASTSTSPMP